MPDNDDRSYTTYDDVGGLPYEEHEQQLLANIAMLLKNRDRDHVVTYDNDQIRPKHYMPMYVKAAAATYEAAKSLARMNATSSKVSHKSVMGWLAVIVGDKFPTYGADLNDENLLTAVNLEKKLIEKPPEKGNAEDDAGERLHGDS